METITINIEDLQEVVSDLVRKTQKFTLVNEKTAVELVGFRHTRSFRELCDQVGIKKHPFGKKFFYDINDIQTQIKKNAV